MSPMLMQRLAKPLLFSAALIWGSSFFIMKTALDSLPAFHLLAFRFTAGAAILALVFLRRWRLLNADYLRRGGVLGGLLFLAYSVQTFGLGATTPSNNAFLTAVYCVIVPFLCWAVSKKPPDGYHLLAALLCITGVGLVCLTQAFVPTAGDLLTLLCAFFYAAHIVAVSAVSPGRDIYLLTAVQFVVCALLSWVGALLFEPFPAAALTRSEVVLPLFYLCVMATAVALLFQNVGQVWAEPSVAAMILSLEAVFGVLCAVIFYGDPVTPRLMAGFSLIFAAILCAETKLSFLKRAKLP